MKETFQKLISYGEAPVPRDIDMFGTEDQATDGLTQQTFGADTDGDQEIISYEVGTEDEDDIESFQSEEMLEKLKLGWNARDHVEVGELGKTESEYVEDVNHELWQFLHDADRALEHEELEADSIDFAAGREGVARLVGKVATQIQGHVSGRTKERLQERADELIQMVATYEAHKDILLHGDLDEDVDKDREAREDLIATANEIRDDRGERAAEYLQGDDDFNVAAMPGMESAEEKIKTEEKRRRADTAGVPAGSTQTEDGDVSQEKDDDDTPAPAGARGDGS